LAQLVSAIPVKHSVIDRFLPDSEAGALLAWLIGSEACFAESAVQGGTSPEVDHTIRHSFQLSGDLGRHCAAFEQAIHESFEALCEAIGIAAFDVAFTELDCAAHGDGGHYAAHIDTFTQDVRMVRKTDRVLSAVLYLCTEPARFSGGELAFYRFGTRQGDQPQVRIAPRHNRLVVFPAIAPHAVLPVSCPGNSFADYRFAINCWLHRSRS
jgi:SM-20-related protein